MYFEWNSKNGDVLPVAHSYALFDNFTLAKCLSISPYTCIINIFLITLLLHFCENSMMFDDFSWA